MRLGLRWSRHRVALHAHVVEWVCALSLGKLVVHRDGAVGLLLLLVVEATEEIVRVHVASCEGLARSGEDVVHIISTAFVTLGRRGAGHV